MGLIAESILAGKSKVIGLHLMFMHCFLCASLKKDNGYCQKQHIPINKAGMEKVILTREEGCRSPLVLVMKNESRR